jgi:hypothetical protein
MTDEVDAASLLIRLGIIKDDDLPQLTEDDCAMSVANVTSALQGIASDYVKRNYSPYTLPLVGGIATD